MHTYEPHGTLIVSDIQIDLKRSDPVEIATMLVMSTAHLSQETMEILSSDATWHSRYGAMFNIASVDEETPGDLLACAKFAKRYGVHYIQFDSDGPLYNGLGRFDW